MIHGEDHHGVCLLYKACRGLAEGSQRAYTTYGNHIGAFDRFSDHFEKAV